ncbi:UNVERIFIED_CONTAM: hypothetical protein Sangu_2351600 [Sesamum angustifolium]|uniref:Uncharacterized protein n=1 Tax=Sesamum angustifolium TaxID=2727405 RepID=A0AAW2KW11_9LAMI
MSEEFREFYYHQPFHDDQRRVDAAATNFPYSSSAHSSANASADDSSSSLHPQYLQMFDPSYLSFTEFLHGSADHNSFSTAFGSTSEAFSALKKRNRWWEAAKPQLRPTPPYRPPPLRRRQGIRRIQTRARKKVRFRVQATTGAPPPKVPGEETRGEIIPRPFSCDHHIRRATQPPRSGDSPWERGRNVRLFHAISGAAIDTGRSQLPSRAVSSDAPPLQLRRRGEYEQFVSSTAAVPAVSCRLWTLAGHNSTWISQTGALIDPSDIQ